MDKTEFEFNLLKEFNILKSHFPSIFVELVVAVQRTFKGLRTSIGIRRKWFSPIEYHMANHLRLGLVFLLPGEGELG